MFGLIGTQLRAISHTPAKRKPHAGEAEGNLEDCLQWAVADSGRACRLTKRGQAVRITSRIFEISCGTTVMASPAASYSSER